MTPSKAYTELTVGDVMATEPVTARPGNTLADVQALMEESDIHHLPIVDSDGCVVGILSDRDLRRATGRNPRAVIVSDLMTEDPLSVRPDTRLCEASALLLEHKIGGLPVVDRSDVVVGIITDTDFLRIAHVVLGGDALSTDEDD